jgi:Lar family restriction alleviation protein
METIAIKSCPFCGSPSVGLSCSGDHSNTRSWIECHKCHAKGPEFNDPDFPGDEVTMNAVEAWNRRV